MTNDQLDYEIEENYFRFLLIQVMHSSCRFELCNVNQCTLYIQVEFELNSSWFSGERTVMRMFGWECQVGWRKWTGKIDKKKTATNRNLAKRFGTRRRAQNEFCGLQNAPAKRQMPFEKSKKSGSNSNRKSLYLHVADLMEISVWRVSKRVFYEEFD